MLDLHAPIEPGRGLGGVLLGCPVAELLAAAEPVRVVELPGEAEGEPGVAIHSFGPIRTWSVEGQVVQVGAFEGYRGRTAAGVGLGSTVTELRAACGEVVPMGAEGMLTAPAVPGMGIETTAWATADSPDPAARVLQIFVHAIGA